ncbi:MAG: hypothetical protein WCT85_06030 [Parachlamydiales bacterium]|jgi:hypothetical protein
MKNYRLLAIIVLLFMIPQTCIYSTPTIPKYLNKGCQKRINKNWLSSHVYNKLVSVIDQFEEISSDEHYAEEMNEEQLESFTNLVVGLAILGSSKADPVKNAILLNDIEKLYSDEEDILSCNFNFQNYYPGENRNFIFAEKDLSYEIVQCTNIFKKTGRGIKKGVKATGRGIRKGGEAVAHAGKKTGQFIVEHKEQVLAGVGIIAGIAVGTMVVCKIVEENSAPPITVSANNNPNPIISNQSANNSTSSQEIEKNNPSSLFSNIEWQDPIPDNKLPPAVQNQISFLKNSIDQQLLNNEIYSGNPQDSKSVEQNKEFSQNISSEIAHTILDIAATTGLEIKEVTSLVTHNILGGAEEGINLLNLLGEEFQKEISDVSKLISPLINQDLNLGTDSKNNLNLKDAFAKAHEKVDEFFSTDLSDYYNMGAPEEFAIGYIPFFPAAEGAAIARQALTTFKTIEQEAALAEELSLSAKEIARIESQITDNTINSIAKENFIKNENNLLKISCPEKNNIVDEVAIQLKQWLQEDYTVITNKAGDKVFLSKDGLRKIRYDFENPHGDIPHMHIQEKINGKWVDASDSHRIYPKNS